MHRIASAVVRAAVIDQRNEYVVFPLFAVT